jgi:type VI protein secretion system component VasK
VGEGEGVLKRWEFWTLTAVALATALVVVANMYRFSANRQLQAEVSQRGLFIQQSIPLENLSREIALALAQLGVKSQDEQIRALLGSLGITITVNQPAPAAQAEVKGARK